MGEMNITAQCMIHVFRAERAVEGYGIYSANMRGQQTLHLYRFVVSIDIDDLIHLCIPWCVSPGTDAPQCSRCVGRRISVIKWAENFDGRLTPIMW